MLLPKRSTCTLFLSILLLTPLAHARDTILYLPIKDALESPEAKDKLDSSITFSFGTSAGGKPVRTALVANKKTNAFGKSDEAACQWAFISALLSFQDTAKQAQATKVNNLVSYYKRAAHSSTSEYECHAGNVMAGVALRGDIAK